MNVYNVTVKVADNGNPSMSATQNVTITVNDANDAPTFDTTPADFDFDENTETNAVVATYMASDVGERGNTLAWSLVGTDKSDFSIGSSTGELKFASNPNFESPADTATLTTTTR